VTRLGTKADPAINEIAVDGRPIVVTNVIHAFALSKPAGVVSTRDDDRGRPTVMAFVPAAVRGLVYPVGRLDLKSTGLVLLTNDGALAFRLTHPSYHVPKTYRVRARRPIGRAQAEALAGGVELDDGLTAPAEVTLDADDPSMLTMVLYEGRKRQIRRMLTALGNETTSLRRTAIGPLGVGRLADGETRPVTDAELGQLRKAVGLAQ